MSAPDPDPSERAAHHAIPLLGMPAAVIFAVGIIRYWLTDEMADAPGPTDGIDLGMTPPAAPEDGAVDIGTSP